MTTTKWKRCGSLSRGNILKGISWRGPSLFFKLKQNVLPWRKRRSLSHKICQSFTSSWNKLFSSYIVSVKKLLSNEKSLKINIIEKEAAEAQRPLPSQSNMSNSQTCLIETIWPAQSSRRGACPHFLRLPSPTYCHIKAQKPQRKEVTLDHATSKKLHPSLFINKDNCWQ